MPDSTANLSFLPSVREGAAAAIPATDTLLPQRGVADLAVSLSINNAPGAAITVRLRGPADVTGIDARQIVRMDPLPDSKDFEPNYFACVEFDRPDHPWLFTPARANASGQLRPWLCLVVVREQAGVGIDSASASSLPVLRIAPPARPIDELPDLAECSAWAHAQVAALDTSSNSVRAALNGATELSLSRLVCPRRLEPDTAYIACVVPTFELGLRAGLGDTIPESDTSAADALAAAWSMTPQPPKEVKLPIYHQWRFRTGAIGDFASLARQLQPQPAPAGLGLRKIDVSHPGFAVSPNMPAGTTIDLEGALKPMDAPDALPAWPSGIESAFKSALAPIVNAPGLAAIADPRADPLLAPALYGKWYAARSTVAQTASSWLDQLNLEPRYRAIAAFGTQVVQQDQEALMASAWEQAAELSEANRRLRRLQLSLVVGKALLAKHISTLAPEAMMRVAAPAFGRLRTTTATDPAAKTVFARIASTALPVQATSSAMSRIGRVRGPLTRRVSSQGVTRPADATWIGKMNVGSVGANIGTAILVSLPASGLATITTVRQRLPSTVSLASYGTVTRDAVANMRGRPLFRVAAEGQPVTAPPLQGLPPSADSAAARDFRAAASEHLLRVNPGRTIILPPMPAPLRIDELRTAMLGSLEPRMTFTALTRALVTAGANAAPPVGTPASAPVGIDTIAAAPHFPQPMYEPLRDLSQDLLLPGLASVDPDTVLGLKTNRRFIEAYMVGLNVEMAGELLWRGFPTDQRSTYFDQFWDVGAAKTPRPDIDSIRDWGNRKLGDATGAPVREQFVMLMRSALLRRYPNAIIYAAPAIASGGTRKPDLDPARELFPAFRGDMKPDVSFFGFDITPAQAQGSDGSAGYYIVIQEHPTEPRFGLDVATPAGKGTHVRIADGPPTGLPATTLTWGRNAAHVAGMLRRRPFRVAIHASKLVRKP